MNENLPNLSPVAQTESNPAPIIPQEKVAPKLNRIVVPVANKNNPSASSFTPVLLDKTVDSDADVLRRAKLLAPGIRSAIKLVDSTAARVTSKQIQKCGFESERADKIANSGKISDEAERSIVDAGSRILARRVKSDETADVIVLSTGLLAWTGGWMDVVNEIRQLRAEVAQMRRENQQKKAA